MFQFFQLWRRAGKSGRVHSALARGELQKSRRARQRFLRPVVEQLEARWLLAPILVTTELDIVNPNDTFTSLREAVVQANGLGGHDTITFASSLANQPVFLLSGQMTIMDALTIQGLGADKTTVNGLGASRLFDITNTAGDVTFDGLTLTGGKTTADDERGGAIRSVSNGQLTIQKSTISGNSTTGTGADGGGIYARHPLTVTNSTVSGNSTTGEVAQGGGIAAFGTLTVTNSTVSGNSTTGERAQGGGIVAIGSATITNSTISGNSMTGVISYGGGIHAQRP